MGLADAAGRCVDGGGATRRKPRLWAMTISLNSRVRYPLTAAVTREPDIPISVTGGMHFINLVGPRPAARPAERDNRACPIGWIAPQDAEGQRNPGAIQLFNCFNYRPPIIGFASKAAGKTAREISSKKSEFVQTRRRDRWAMAMNETSASIPAP